MGWPHPSGHRERAWAGARSEEKTRTQLTRVTRGGRARLWERKVCRRNEGREREIGMSETWGGGGKGGAWHAR